MTHTQVQVAPVLNSFRQVPLFQNHCRHGLSWSPSTLEHSRSWQTTSATKKLECPCQTASVVVGRSCSILVCWYYVDATLENSGIRAASNGTFCCLLWLRYTTIYNLDIQFPRNVGAVPADIVDQPTDTFKVYS